MSLIVQKFGGTSVGNPERIKNVARRVQRSRAKGHQIVVVVSAMSGVTDNLIKLAKEIHPSPDEREMDVLLSTGEQTTIALAAMALHALELKAISLTGAQAGIVTYGSHSKAKISNITPKRIHELLDDGNVVIVAGFQGTNEEGAITTLGRGGSDLTAIALAAALKADLCEIYTDVDGVYTADPRIVKNARKLEEISYDEMLELASLGAKVMQSRSVEFAKKFGVPFSVRSSMNDNEGTLVKAETRKMEEVVIRGASLDKHQAKVAITHVPDKPGVASRIFKTIANANINVDMIVQTIAASGVTDISFTVAKDDIPKTRKVLESLVKEVEAGGFQCTEGIAKLSVVGIGMRSHTGVAADMFETLAKEKVNIQMISTSEIKISVIIDGAHADRALNVIHDRFELGKEQA